LYCQNPDTISLVWGTETSAVDILKQVLEVKPYFGPKGGFTVSGWEPLLQANALIPLFRMLKAEDIHIAVDTNGFPRNDDVKEMIELADLFLVDIKQINNDLHKKLTGQSNENTLKLISYLEEHQKQMWIRYVLLTGYTDNPDDMHEIGKRYGQFKHIERLEILPYHNLGVYKYEELGMKYELEWIPMTTHEQAQTAKAVFDEYFAKVVIRG
jgi:pyruvate formate lyase activating enzyme